MKVTVAIIAVVVFCAAYALIKTMYTPDKMSREKSRIGADEAAESAADGGEDE